MFEGDGLSFPQVEKVASELLETRSDFSYLVLKAPGDCFFQWGSRGPVPGKVTGTC